jgi:hypothetical protein
VFYTLIAVNQYLSLDDSTLHSSSVAIDSSISCPVFTSSFVGLMTKRVLLMAMLSSDITAAKYTWK